MQHGTRGNPNANILIVGEAYGENEARLQQPFMGESGRELERMLREAGINPNDCFYTNVVNDRPDNNEMWRFFIPTDIGKKQGLAMIRGLYPGPKIVHGLQNLEALIRRLKPKVIIALGNYALWALTDRAKVGPAGGDGKGYKAPKGALNYRGSQLRCLIDDIPVLPTLHPAAVLRNWKTRAHVIHDLRARVPLVFKGLWDEPDYNFIIRPSFDKVMETLTGLRLRAQMTELPMFLSVDIETIRYFIECIGIAWSKHDAICVPLMSKSGEENYFTVDEETAILQELHLLLELPNVEVIGQNFLYDYQHFSYYFNMKVRWTHDTMIAQHTCFPGTPLDLGHLSSLYCDHHVYWKDDGKEATSKEDDDQRWIYNAKDCCKTFEIMTEIWKVIDHYDLWEQYAIQMNRVNSAVEMTLRGVRINEKLRGEEKLKHLEVMQELEMLLYEVLPESIYTPKPKAANWYTAPLQQAEIFYDILGVPPVRSDTGAYTTDDDALRKIGNREPALKAVCTWLSQFRSLRVFWDFLAMRVGRDGRARSTFSPTTSTYRYRSGDCALGYGRNLQNIPKGEE